MIGGPKPLAGGFSITSLPRTEAPATQAPETKAPEAGTPTEQSTGRSGNPVLRSLLADRFEGHGAQGRGLALGHLKRAARADKAEGSSKEALDKLIGDLQKLIEQLMAQLSGKPQQQPGTTTPGNTGIVPPGVTTPGNTGIVPPGNTGIVPPGTATPSEI